LRTLVMLLAPQLKVFKSWNQLDRGYNLQRKNNFEFQVKVTCKVYSV
jgi:hypothetical protein